MQCDNAAQPPSFPCTRVHPTAPSYLFTLCCIPTSRLPPHCTQPCTQGDPALYENTLTPDGITAARAAAGAAAVAETQHLPPDASAAAGVVMAQQQQQHDATSTTPSPLHDDTTAATAAATAAAGSSSSSDGTESSPFAPEAALLRLPLLGAAGVTQSGVCLCPGVPNTAALGVKGGLTKVVPAELHLPKQHAQLFRWVGGQRKGML